ncbi:right-handed parallel beta-helix repeat-containing protein [Sphingobium nicotianae]|uniref:Right-handed parallel beta-helix repeat-containing protein n=1 Tax=Sphingobium nicotianae TaxID=2782607 RepID=A0A9X1DG68_9SPHN|nr:right-handed parallel beta-helix repeat-containing protein [Sphingobium nicotianae]MBT2188883.1 right-handed parallel beta-helix repeat-containing protein [Sphingobium nicotianae]
MKRFALLAFPLIAVGLATLASAQQAGAPFTVVETGRGYGRLADAIGAIGEGEGTILVAPGTYRQCAVQGAGSITIRARERGTAIFDRTICEQKAALVLRGRSATIDGLVFQGMAVPDGNGAGIRLEAGNLSVAYSTFRNSEEGILTGGDPNGAIRIDRSTFSRLGRCDRDLDCAHSIYIGGYGSLSVTRSRFEAGNGGHYVKSRAPHVEVIDNSFDDSQGKQTNYMIDLPAGATGRIENNVMVQGRDKENWSAFIALGAEGNENGSAGLVVQGNRASYVPGLVRNSAFLADWAHDKLAVGANVIGPGVKPYERR